MQPSERPLLVNIWNPLPKGCKPNLVTLPNGMQIDRICLSHLMEMLEGCRAAGDQRTPTGACG